MLYWKHTEELDNAHTYKCGYCNLVVGTKEIYNYTGDYMDSLHMANGMFISICPSCDKPTYFDLLDGSSIQIPNNMEGIDVEHISDEEVESLYNEARNCMSVGAYTASALCSRKLLMNIAVKKGAKEGLKFIQYIDWLDENRYIPPNSKLWVDQIRVTGNEATHKIEITTKEDAKISLKFLGMILKFIYEFPAMMK